MLSLLLFLVAGTFAGVATHHSAIWYPKRAFLALGAGVALQSLVVAIGPSWHVLVGPDPSVAPVFRVGLYRAGLVFLPLAFAHWGNVFSRLAAAAAWLGAVSLVGSLSFPFCGSLITFNDAPITPTSEYFGALVALIPLGLGLAVGRAAAQARWLQRAKHAAT